MACYFVANIKIHDPATYQNYIDKAGKIFSKYNGEYLAVDNSPDVLEGEWKYMRSVIITFPTKEDFKKWYFSKEYQEILKFRLTGALCDSILVAGK